METEKTNRRVLAVLPSSAKALAAAAMGERVTLRVPFIDQPPDGLKITYSGVFGWSAVDVAGRVYSFRRPVGRGQPVEVECRCESCGGSVYVDATALTDPIPEQRCEPEQWVWKVEAQVEDAP